MSYLLYLFTLIFKFSNDIKIPIPVFPGLVVNFSIFSLFVGFLVLSIILWFIFRLLDFEILYFFNSFGRLQNNDFHGYVKNKTNYNIENSINRGKIRYKYNKTNPSSVHYSKK